MKFVKNMNSFLLMFISESSAQLWTEKHGIRIFCTFRCPFYTHTHKSSKTSLVSQFTTTATSQVFHGFFFSNNSKKLPKMYKSSYSRNQISPCLPPMIFIKLPFTNITSQNVCFAYIATKIPYTKKYSIIDFK